MVGKPGYYLALRVPVPFGMNNNDRTKIRRRKRAPLKWSLKARPAEVDRFDNLDMKINTVDIGIHPVYRGDVVLVDLGRGGRGEGANRALQYEPHIACDVVGWSGLFPQHRRGPKEDFLDIILAQFRNGGMAAHAQRISALRTRCVDPHEQRNGKDGCDDLHAHLHRCEFANTTLFSRAA